jgi:2'-hydroxyisoflavone reductase
MHLLVLGGTGFLSSAVVRSALDHGHEVTVVTRGRSGEPPPGVRAVRADRDDEGQLREAVDSAGQGPGPVDAVIDTCGYTVAGARAAAAVLGGVPRYVFVSSISAYRDWPPGPVRGEDDPSWSPDDDLTEYGPMKAESERLLGAALGDRLLAVRAGLIVGPGDRTRRMTSWLDRIAGEERVVVPDTLDQPMAFVDARDLAGWMLRAAGTSDRDWSGAVTATGPAGMATLGGMLRTCQDVVAADGGRAAALVPVPEADLLAAGVEPWRDLPFWLPADVATTAWQVDTTRARSLGLPSRPLAATLADTWAWMGEAGLDHPTLPGRLDAARYG